MGQGSAFNLISLKLYEIGKLVLLKLRRLLTLQLFVELSHPVLIHYLLATRVLDLLLYKRDLDVSLLVLFG